MVYVWLNIALSLSNLSLWIVGGSPFSMFACGFTAASALFIWIDAKEVV